MNSLERTMAAVKFKPVDKVPVDLHNFQMCARASGMDFDCFLTSGEAMARGQLDLWHRFHHDVLLLESGTVTLAQALGCKVVYRKNNPPAVHQPFLGDITEVAMLEPNHNLFKHDCIQENLKATEIVVNELKDQAFIVGRGDQGPFSLAALLLGTDKLLMEIALGENLDLIHKLLDYCTNFIINYCIAQLEHGAHCTSIGDSTAGPDLISPSAYCEYAFPYEKRIVDAVHQFGGLISLHICGNATKIIEQMVQTGADIIEIDEKTELSTAKGAAKGKAALLGQVSPALLRTGKTEEVREEALRNIHIMGKETGFILGPGCALASDTPDENIFALISARDL